MTAPRKPYRIEIYSLDLSHKTHEREIKRLILEWMQVGRLKRENPYSQIYRTHIQELMEDIQTYISLQDSGMSKDLLDPRITKLLDKFFKKFPDRYGKCKDMEYPWGFLHELMPKYLPLKKSYLKSRFAKNLCKPCAPDVSSNIPDSSRHTPRPPSSPKAKSKL